MKWLQVKPFVTINTSQIVSVAGNGGSTEIRLSNGQIYTVATPYEDMLAELKGSNSESWLQYERERENPVLAAALSGNVNDTF